MTQDSVKWIQNFAKKTQDAVISKNGKHDSGFIRIQDSGFRIQNSGFRMQDAGYRIHI